MAGSQCVQGSVHAGGLGTANCRPENHATWKRVAFLFDAVRGVCFSVVAREKRFGSRAIL
jgi:hypothetical protein